MAPASPATRRLFPPTGLATDGAMAMRPVAPECNTNNFGSCGARRHTQLKSNSTLHYYLDISC